MPRLRTNPVHAIRLHDRVNDARGSPGKGDVGGDAPLDFEHEVAPIEAHGPLVVKTAARWGDNGMCAATTQIGVIQASLMFDCA